MRYHLIAACLIAAPALAQTPSTTAPSRTMPPATSMPSVPGATSNVPVPGASTSTGVAPGAGMVERNSGTAAAAGDRNQAVTTTSANAPNPARGRSSFTAGQARRRIEARGFSTVSDLRKDGGGVWRGRAMKDGASVGVWLDYKGNIGQQ